MLYVLLDTSVYIALAGGNFPEILDAIIEKIDRTHIAVLSNEVLISEWDRHKEDTRKRIIKRIKSEASSARRLLNYLSQEKKDILQDALTEYQEREVEQIEAANSIIAKVDSIIKEKSIMVEITTEDKLQTVNVALAKKAPFHNKENSVADALILFSTINYIKRLPKDEEFFGSYFVSINPDDYSISTQEHEKNQIHSELKPYLDEIEMKYSTDLKDALSISDELNQQYLIYIEDLIDAHIEWEAEIMRGK